tara:strand:- start:12139 stop:12669 length:531 start_codon:yes stop_codon:yes gene_type:complete
LIEDWWLLLKANPRSRRENKKLQEMKNRIDRKMREEESERYYNADRLKAFARQVARDYRDEHGTTVAERNVEIREPRPTIEERMNRFTGEVYQPYQRGETYEGEPIREQRFDEKARGMQPHLTAHVKRQARPVVEMDRYESAERLDYPTDPDSYSHGVGTPAHTQARQVRAERRGY